MQTISIKQANMDTECHVWPNRQDIYKWAQWSLLWTGSQWGKILTLDDVWREHDGRVFMTRQCSSRQVSLYLQCKQIPTSNSQIATNAPHVHHHHHHHLHAPGCTIAVSMTSLHVPQSCACHHAAHRPIYAGWRFNLAVCSCVVLSLQDGWLPSFSGLYMSKCSMEAESAECSDLTGLPMKHRIHQMVYYHSVRFRIN